jgi:deoxyribodipyrimidine photo-lyase
MKKIPVGLFIFHRDFRLFDNIGLINASQECEKLYTCFIFTPDQVGKSNDYRSQNSIEFMIESLTELSSDIKKNGGELMTFYGEQTIILRNLVHFLNVNAIFFNKDYTPYAIERTNRTMNLCNKLLIECKTYSDYYLYEPGSIKTGTAHSGTAYKKYTPFYNAVIDLPVESPKLNKLFNLAKIRIYPSEYKISLKEAMERFTKINENILVHGGRTHGKKRLKLALREQVHYDDTRDFFINRTTFLSAYIKFGCLSIREVYHFFKKSFGLKHGLIRELLWREFFAHVLYAYPNVVGNSYQKIYKNLNWSKNETNFDKWKNGETGFPLVDACMRELNTTGFMHNRGRMTVASFLIKTLMIDWRWGEKYFAQKLTDYDLASNNGNWQGISGTGVDMKPYFRDMNPWIQSEKFDKLAEYIKKWVPELADVVPSDIHKWHISYENPKYKNIKYPKPMVNYDEQKEKMLEFYKNT